MSNENSVAILTENLKTHLERLLVYREYRTNTKDPYVTSALSFAVEDVQEAIARVSSRLRQLGAVSPTKISEDVTEKLLHQSRSRRTIPERLRFVHHGLQHQLNWYQVNIKKLVGDPDSQAILVGLAEQTRLRLERWENLMDEMKVSPDS